VKVLLRSVIKGDRIDDPDLLLRNYQALVDADLPCDIAEDSVIWKYVRDFTGQYHHVPDAATLRGHFSATHQLEVVDRIDALMVQNARTQGDFLRYLEGRVEDRRVRVVSEILREAGRIVEVGVTVKEGREEKLIRGPMQAIRYVLDRGHEITTPSSGVVLSGDVTSDGHGFVREIERIESDPLAGIGQYSGIDQMDRALRGAKRGELWTHTAFTGSLKSTLALNWLYNQAVYYRHSNILFSLEMPYPQVRRILYAMHSFHEKFDDVRRGLGVKRCVPYQKIRDGEMSPQEREFLLQYVVKDFNDPANQYGSIHIEVADPDKSDFTMIDMRNKAELLRSKDPAISMLVVDHAGLMAPRNRQPSTTERLNEVVRDLKRLAMNFDRGAGIAVLNLFQISREGYKSAEKNGGKYNLTHLSYSNECVPFHTPTYTQSGIKYLGDVQIGDRVWSNSGWKAVSAFFDQGVQPIWEIVTDRGSVLESTAGHRVRVIRDEQLTWGQTADLKVGDWVVGTKAGAFVDAPPSVPAWGDMTTLTDDLAYLLGAWHGDGVVLPGGVGFTGNRLETAVRDRISNTLTRVHGTKEARVHNYPSRPGSFDLELYDVAFKLWWDQIAGLRGEVVPDIISRAPRKQVLQFMRGLFDTDGCINRVGVISLTSKSKALLHRVQDLLLRCGIDTSLSSRVSYLAKTGKSYPGYSLNIRGWVSIKSFIREIGFTDDAKAHRGELRISNMPKRKMSDQGYPYPQMFADMVRDLLPHSMAAGGHVSRSIYNKLPVFLRRGFIAEDTLRYVLDILSGMGVSDARMHFFKNMLDTWHVLRVVSCAPTGREERVYDIEVDGDHEYQTGPLLSHNCERSSDIVTAGWVDEELRSKNLLRLQCLKARDDAPFEDFYAGVVFDCRRIHTAYDVTLDRAQKAGDEIDLGV
jgi:replicative DNA helicase